MEAEKVDVVVAGAGFAGLACAWQLARAGVEVVVVERGENPGAKSVTGGRLYTGPVRRHLPDLFDKAPLQRAVVSERLTAVSKSRSATLDFRAASFREPAPQSYTVLPGPFLQWMAEEVLEKGGMVIPGNCVDLVLENGRVAGVEGPDATLTADVVVAADGVLSFLAEKAGLRPPFKPSHFAVGIKEIIELPAKTIEDRFGCAEGEGAAQLFVGTLTGGLFGGGFLYTNRESISLGLVMGIEDLAKAGGEERIYDLLDRFKARPEMEALLSGGETVEYAAHVIPEGGMDGLPRLFDDRILVAGDAAGFAVNAGFTVRGMDFALASGAIAAEAILAARERKDFSASSLAVYEKKLKDSFILQEMEQTRRMPALLQNPRWFTEYPDRMADILEDLFVVGDRPKGRMGKRAWGWARKFPVWRTLRDVWALLRS
ncbi:MAG: FAD-dependent oxidoreductase [Planctomycetota bacterium]